MDLDKLAEAYFSAWNRQDLEGLLALLHKDASFYDAFWMETCVGQDLAQYFSDSFEEEDCRYEQIGGAIRIENGFAIRYLAFERDRFRTGRALYNGAEVLILQGDKIVTISDFYCNPHESSLEEVARLAAIRHGQSNYAQSGLSARKRSIFRDRLSAIMDEEHAYLDSKLTLTELARRIGCPTKLLSLVLSNEFGTDFHHFVDERRVRFARKLLSEQSDDPKYMLRIANKAGFRSLENFDSAFRKAFGVTPAEFRRRNVTTTDQTSNRSLN